jgi:cytosine/adenosine deaminase-related metal-dependent hydrolase
MIRDLRLASYLGSLRENDPTVVPAECVLEMATLHGARALGLQDEVGSIEPGKRADLIVIDMDKPHLVPCWDPVSTIAYAANGGDVDTVMIDGQIVMQGRRVTTLDEEAIVEEARRRAPAVAERAGLKLGPRWPAA